MRLDEQDQDNDPSQQPGRHKESEVAVHKSGYDVLRGYDVLDVGGGMARVPNPRHVMRKHPGRRRSAPRRVCKAK